MTLSGYRFLVLFCTILSGCSGFFDDASFSDDASQASVRGFGQATPDVGTVAQLIAGESALIPVAHRGVTSLRYGLRLTPDNSLSAVALASSTAVPAVELDVRHNSSGSLILFHDRHLRASAIFSDVSLLGREVASIRDDQLSRVFLDAARKEKIPSLYGVLSLAVRWGVVVFLDIKDEERFPTGTLLDVIDSAGAVPSVVIQNQSIESFLRFRAVAPRMFLHLRAFSEEDFERAVSLRPTIVQVDPDVANPETIAHAAKTGVAILMKAAGTPYDKLSGWCALWRLGARLVLTDSPIEMAAVFWSQTSAAQACRPFGMQCESLPALEG